MHASRVSVATHIQSTVITLLGTAILMGLAAVVSWTWVNWQRNEVNAGLCQGRLKYLALAVLNYCDEYGELPPTCIRSAEGQPMHSWRVLILPYCEKDDFYRRYDFSQPWNSPHNMALNESYPDIAAMFQCPSDPGQFHGWTSYLAIVGKDTLWQEDRPASREELWAKPRKVLLVEKQESGIHWMQPEDMLAGNANRDVSTAYPHEIHCAFGDGGVGNLDHSDVKSDPPPDDGPRK